jgi:hypothetical protein
MEKNEVFLENLEADVQSQNRAYGLKYHSKSTAPSSNVRSKV